MSFDEVPCYGWKARLNHEFIQKRLQNLDASFRQVLPMIPLVFRRKPVMDFLKVVQDEHKSGVPIGGIGAGTIGRGFKGEFCRYQLVPGIYEYNTVAANQFIVTIKDKDFTTLCQKVLSCEGKPKGSHLSSWEWDLPALDAEYTALYPCSYTTFDVKQERIKLLCIQLTPIIPQNYKDSSLPCAAFRWIVHNYNNHTRYVSITFTMKNGTGSHNDKNGEAKSQAFEKVKDNCTVKGVLISQKINNIPCTYAVAALNNVSSNVTTCSYFDPKSNGSEFWEYLKENGEFVKQKPTHNTRKGQELACAVSCKTSIESNGEAQADFCFVWDMPKIKFPNSDIWYSRYYTKHFGNSGDIGPELCLYALTNFNNWKESIDKWQKPILDDIVPDWYKSALLNELYYIADGGTVWVLLDEKESKTLPHSDPRIKYGRFAYLEGHEYRMYNTYDVHFYASASLVKHWPKLQQCLHYDIRDSIKVEDRTIRWYLYNGERTFVKTKNTVPHDLGDPVNNPFAVINSYPIHDVSNWKDLNLKFVLQVYRDFVVMRDKKYLHHMFPEVKTVMEHSLKWDTDNTGMIQNSGFPDQTYDNWVMTGVSAYCGSLWLAALTVFTKMAAEMKDFDLEIKYLHILTKAKKVFDEKLWNGQYFNFDNNSKTIMADQLCGLWYLHCSGVKDQVFNKEHVKSALEHIYNNNVLKYYDGKQGAVNGMTPDGQIDTSSTQSQEVWTGVTYALAALLIFEGKVDEGLATVKGMYETIYEKSGLGFATPEALCDLTRYRSVGYMRPLSIWSVQAALEWNKQKIIEERRERIIKGQKLKFK